jgi:hypothetical protein
VDLHGLDKSKMENEKLEFNDWLLEGNLDVLDKLDGRFEGCFGDEVDGDVMDENSEW